jgi:hypothetical protein
LLTFLSLLVAVVAAVVLALEPEQEVTENLVQVFFPQLTFL